MRILIVLIRLKGGVGRANKEIAKVLRAKGHEVDILSREDDLNIYSLKESIAPLRKRIKELMVENNYNIIYTQDYSCALPLIFPYRIFTKQHFTCFCGIKTGVHPTLYQKDQKYLQKIVAWKMKNHLVVIGDELHRAFPKATKIYRGVNNKEFRPLNKERKYLGWIDKDISEINEKQLDTIAKAVGLTLLVGKDIKPENMNNFYNQCKVFIDLPRTAGFNLSWLEAMASGVPIVIGNPKGAGSFLPIITLVKNDNETIINAIKYGKEMDYNDWIIENDFLWEDKADELIKYFVSKTVS